MKKKLIIAAAFIIVAAVMFAAGLLAGKSLWQRPEVSFYANVLDNNETSLLVEGIPENDVNHRGQFYVSLIKPNDKNAVTDAFGKPMALSDIKTGMQVRIVYDGMVLESYPAQIRGAYNIQIIE